MVVVGVCFLLIVLPICLMVMFQIGTNRFLRETERSLLHQAAIYSAAYAEAFETATTASGGGAISGYYLPPNKRVFWMAESRTFAPLLNLRRDGLEDPAPLAETSGVTSAPRYQAIAPTLAELARRSKPVTLSSVRFLDHEGHDFLSDGALNYASHAEVEKALEAEVGTAIRRKSEVAEGFSLNRFGRGTGYRIYLAYPVITENRVIGVILLSRTPPDLFSYLKEERAALLQYFVVLVIAALLLGSILVRIIVGPLRALRDHSRMVASGNDTKISPSDRFGLHEMAELGGSIRLMSKKLASRSKEISSYSDHVTHELKSPVTSITGAAELLSSAGLSNHARQKMIETISTQAARMDSLLKALREMTRARHYTPGEPARLRDMMPDWPALRLRVNEPDAVLPLSAQHGTVVLHQLLQNAKHHGATEVVLTWDGQVLRIADNGAGFPDGDLSRLVDPFYTTRRETGGTGMGLAISATILALYDAELKPVQSDAGAIFDIRLPGNDSNPT